MMSDATDAGLRRPAVKDMDAFLRWPAMLDMDMGSRNYLWMNIMQYNHEDGKIEIYRCDRRTGRPPKDICLNCRIFCFL